jgi:RNA polymerase sigma factor (sigma-70 family)
MSGATTGDLACEASRGDEGALEEIYRDYHQPLYRFCLAIVGNPHDAQDALQNTMVKMLRALPGEKRSIALKPWLYRIAHNESIDVLRRRRPDVSLETSEPQLGEDLAVQFETRQQLCHLIADLSALPERQRETLLMREAAGLSFEEIGAALQTSSAVARQTLYEARLGLRQMDAGREMECETVTKALSDGDGRVRRRRDIRAHLRDCSHCRGFAEEIDSRSGTLAAISPLPVVAATAMLHGLLGSGTAGGTAAGAGAGAGTGGIGGLVGGATVKSVGTATLLKGVAAVAVVAAIGAGAADRAGLIQIGGNSVSKAPAGARPSDAGAAPAGGASDSSAAQSSGESRRSARSSLSKAASVRRGGADRAVDPARGISQPASAGADPVASGPPPAGSGSTDTAASPGASGGEHPHGRGHTKQTPAAAAHGQETAASHEPEKSHSSNGSEPGSGKGKSAEHPAHPTHPATPATSSPPPAAEPKAKSPPGKPPK